jgi:2-polyprenyl-3-methyl-5-hydroxy-6-metoxy-1,4-benzoquinol methylase
MTETANHASLARFLEPWLTEDRVRDFSEIAGVDCELGRQLLSNYVSETHVALDLVAPYLARDLRILEVGPGIPFFSAYLTHLGYSITVVDAAEPPFDVLQDFFRLHCHRLMGERELDFLQKDVADIQPAELGRFDLIFSLNVLEHVADVPRSMRAMLNCLERDGIMVHSCPNYAIPYEPHYGVVLLPFSRRANMFLYRSLIRRSRALWDSLNFITGWQVKRLEKTLPAQIDLEPGVLFRTVSRLQSDPVFAARHSWLVWPARLLSALGLLKLLKLIPARVATPMTFTVRHSPADTPTE